MSDDRQNRKAAALAKARRQIDAARSAALAQARAVVSALPRRERRWATPRPLASAAGRRLGIMKVGRPGRTIAYVSIQWTGQQP